MMLRPITRFDESGLILDVSSDRVSLILKIKFSLSFEDFFLVLFCPYILSCLGDKGRFI